MLRLLPFTAHARSRFATRLRVRLRCTWLQFRLRSPVVAFTRFWFCVYFTFIFYTRLLRLPHRVLHRFCLYADIAVTLRSRLRTVTLPGLVGLRFCYGYVRLRTHYGSHYGTRTRYGLPGYARLVWFCVYCCCDLPFAVHSRAFTFPFFARTPAFRCSLVHLHGSPGCGCGYG